MDSDDSDHSVVAYSSVMHSVVTTANDHLSDLPSVESSVVTSEVT